MKFSTSRFFLESVSPGPLIIRLGSFRICAKIRGDSHNSVFIAGIKDTSDKLFTVVNDTGEKLSLVSLLSAINYCRCR
jgi:hypothetical protein